MNSFEYYAPTKIIFGSGSQRNVGSYIKEQGGSRVFIAYGGGSAVSSGLLSEVESSIFDAGLDYISMGGIVPNPVLSTLRLMINEALDFKADFILAVGGGSVIDTAKSIAHGAANPDVDVWDYYAGLRTVERSLPHGCVLTISAAGSETSDSAVITNDEVEPFLKRGINTKWNRCRFAVMNPELTFTLPKYQIAAGAVDIFMHTSERYFAGIRTNHMSDELAEGLFRTVIKYAKQAVDNPSDYEAASELMWAGSISHVGLTGLGGGGGDWACHQLGMNLSALFDYTHGATLSAVWGAWARYVMDTDVGRFARFARQLWNVQEADDRTAANIGIEKSEEFFASLGMPITLTEMFGREIKPEEAEYFADTCSFYSKRTIGAFRKLDRDDMMRIYRAAI